VNKKFTEAQADPFSRNVCFYGTRMNTYFENIEAITYIKNVYNKEERKEYFRSLKNGPLSNLVH
jgi:hypothetical protein